MVRHLVRSLCFSAIAAALALQGCEKHPGSFDRPAQRIATQAAAVDHPASPSAARRGGKVSDSRPAVSAPRFEQYATGDPPPWLAELLQSPDPNVRIQALDAWARQPTASLNPVTYALVDSDESVRARAQEILEQELARR